MELHPLVVLPAGIVAVLVLIIQVTLNAILALITAATTVGVLSPKIPLGAVMGEVATTFGAVCGSIGIALASLIGQCLMESGAADKIVGVFVWALGEKNSSLSLLTSVPPVRLRNVHGSSASGRLRPQSCQRDCSTPSSPARCYPASHGGTP